MLGFSRAGVIASIKKGLQGILVGPTVITTSTASTATAYSNQRKIDRCQNGVLWSVEADPFYPDFRFFYSTDNGTTWTNSSNLSSHGGGSGTNYTGNCSLFIDRDDYAHLVVKSTGDGYIRYYRGTPNAGRTAWTWSAAVTMDANDPGYNYPDVVAHREGTGWTAHVVFSFNNTFDNGAFRAKINIASNGTITTDATPKVALRDGGYSYGINNHTYPSIDFNHNGDGKTVAGSTPHLYVAWSAGATGAGKGIRFKKATYSGGTWTWGTEREIDSARYYGDANYQSQCLFDGTRVVIVGQTTTAAGASTDLMLYERDAADTTTTVRALGIQHNSFHTSSTYDSVGNIYIVGKLAGSIGYWKWTRSTLTLGPFVSLGSVNSFPWTSAKRGYSNNRIEFIYTNGTASPYNVTYGAIK